MRSVVDGLWKSCGVGGYSHTARGEGFLAPVKNSSFFHGFFLWFSQTLSTVRLIIPICSWTIFHIFHITNNNLYFLPKNYL